MFVDQVTISARAGSGGNGCVSFHREKYVQNGGPDGGDGGDGGDVVIVGDAQMRTLMDFRYKSKYEAPPGMDGTARNRKGKGGENLLVRVPLGTVVRSAADRALLADIRVRGESRVILRGGRGGWGNARFATPTRQAPAFAKPGEKTVWAELMLELKLIADVGLIGFPNAGKSTLLSAVSNAKPKIANYPFTTLSPNIGMVRISGADFALADLPGLIEGASGGAGLGHAFLRHAERTRLLVHVVDVSGSEGRNPADDYRIIRHELSEFSRARSSTLESRAQIVAANKIDMPDSGANLEELRSAVGPGVSVFAVSALTHEGTNALLNEIIRMLPLLPTPQLEAESVIDIESVAPASGFEVIKENGAYLATGPGLRRLVDTVNFTDQESLAWFHKMLNKLGVIDALRTAGARQGDTVFVEEMEYDFVE